MELSVSTHDKKAIVERYLGKGDREEIECRLPALFTVEKGLNDPRYPTLPNRLKAEEAKVEELAPDAFAIESTQSPIEINVGSTLKEASDSFRKSFIYNTLQSTNGNRTQAAKILEVQRSYLSRLIKELGLS